MEYCKILGANISVTDMNRTVAYLTEHLEKLQGKYICVSNVHTTMMAYRDDKYREVQNAAAMALPDGKPLSIISRKRGYVRAKRVPGPDLMPEIFAISKEKGYRHFFFGGREETLRALEKKLREKYPHLQIAGMYSPPFRPMTKEEDEQITKMLREAKPDFIWVALGAPKQEFWMYEHKDKLPGVMIGVGAAFDFLAGTVKRAPEWMQELCLEWFYRIFQDPVRLIPRYVSTNAAFLWQVHRENKKLRKDSKRNAKALKIAMVGHKRIPSREGGVEIAVNELSTRLVERGYKVDAYNRMGDHVSGKRFVDSIGKEYRGIRIITVPTFERRSLNAIVYSFLSSIRVLFGKYDVVHYHAEGPCAMLWIPKLFGRRIVVTIHGLDWQRAKWGNFASKVLKFGEKLAVKYADEVIVLSRNVQNYFKDTYGRRTVFIPNGISRPQLREAQVIKERWQLEKDGYILFLARIVPEKGVHYLIEAYKQIQTDKKLVIAGGRSHADVYLDKVIKMAEGDERIVFTDFVGGQDLEELFSNAYLFVLPSDVEGMAIGLLEAMSYGNCCLVSDIPENLEVIEDKAATFVHGDVQSLREQLQALLESPEAVEQYRSQVADFICGKYNWDEVVDRTIGVYLGEGIQC